MSAKSFVNVSSASVMPKKKVSHKKRRMDREIKKLQESPCVILPRTTFNRIVRDVTDDVTIRYNQDAIAALQTALEEHATKMFEGANVLAEVAGRDTVYVEDLRNFIKLNNM